MTAFRVKSALIFGLLAFGTVSASAQAPSIEPPSLETPAAQAPAPQTPPSSTSPDQVPEARAASFLPPSGQPVVLAPEAASSPPAPPPSPPVTIPANPPPDPPLASTTSPAPANPPPAVSFPSSATVGPAPNTPAKPVGINPPVESGTLPGIDPDAIGLLTAEGGGLGAALWKDTPRELVMRLLPALTLPTASPVLNGLGQRLLLTTANVPEGKDSGGQTLTAMRVEKLVALGDAADAWNLALLAKPGRINEITLRLAAEAALVSHESKNVCAKLPDIVRAHNSPEWQKLLIVCQLREGDRKGAQLALDVLHEQNVADDVFFALAERNVVGGVKSLPRQLTPLKPLNLALLRLTDLAMPPELYAHPETSVIPELLKAKTRDDSVRLGLAERAAARGIINGEPLAEAYRTTIFSQEQVMNPLNSTETGARLRALLYQAAVAEKTPQKRLEDMTRFLQSLNGAPLNATTARILADLLTGITSSSENDTASPAAAQIFIMAGKPKEALAWLKIARQATPASSIAAQLQNFWPLTVLAGLEIDTDYAQSLGPWLDGALKDADRVRREQIAGMLLLFEAAGFAVPESAWTRIIDTPAAGKRTVPPSTLLLERLRTAGTNNRKGETVLLALAVADSNASDASLVTAIETIRALRLIGLTGDALTLARETASALLAPAAAKP